MVPADGSRSGKTILTPEPARQAQTTFYPFHTVQQSDLDLLMDKKATRASGKSLVIVESPAKARTISKFLGDDYDVHASIGHVRDLPKGTREIPAQYKGEDWA